MCEGVIKFRGTNFELLEILNHTSFNIDYCKVVFLKMYTIYNLKFEGDLGLHTLNLRGDRLPLNLNEQTLNCY